MKKTDVFVILLLILLISPLVLASNHTNVSNNSTTSSTSKIGKGFQCLEEKAIDCQSLTTTEVALTILATPDNIFDECVAELESRKNSDNWGNIKDTALAVLALDHAGKNTDSSESWLLNQTRTPTDLIWYLEQDSDAETSCNFKYNTNDYTASITEGKKFQSNAGPCLTRAQSNFWLEVGNNCYNQDIIVSCDNEFIATLLYKNKNSPTIYVLEGTSTAPQYGSVTLNVKSKCFGLSSCDYEATAWATVALLKTGHNVEEYIPYIIAMADTNKRYLPEAFVFMITNYDDYASQLISRQKLGDYWEAEGSANGRFYDTALALLAIGGSSAEQVSNAENWLLFSQGSNGCWQNSVKDTAIILWALEGRSGRLGGSVGGTSTKYCTESNYFCVPKSECPQLSDVGNNFFCPGLSSTCCTTQNLKTCSEYGGSICSTDKFCTGNERDALDTDSCCTGTCEERLEETECESQFYSCQDSCQDRQEEISYSCNLGQICCRAKTTEQETSSKSWIWILVVAIILLLIAILWIYREKLNLLWFQSKSKFRKEKDDKGFSRSSPPGSGRPPTRPFFPPTRRPMAGPPRTRDYDRRDKEMSETFRRLRDMSK